MTDSRNTEIITMGIDPGLRHTGWGIVASRGNKMRCVAYGCIDTSSEKGDAERLGEIFDGICQVVERYKPQELGIESVFFGVNAKSAFAVGQARGAALAAASSRHLMVGEYLPTHIKQSIVGNGHADKEQIQYMTKVLLGLDHLPSPDHAADALAAAICHVHMRGSALL